MRVQTTSARFTGGALLALVLAAPAPVLASHQPNHAGPPGGAATITENNDSDGVLNNIPDEGDNLHPSGKDRSVEHGGSGDQGRSSSTPDQNGRGPERDNGGTDKPNGPGGADIFDQDRNNGCGNDDDFDDDNEGWCGKPKDRGKPQESAKPGNEEQEKPEDHGKLGEIPPLGIAVGQAIGPPPGGGPAGGLAPVIGQPGSPPTGQALGEVVVQGVSGGNVMAASQERVSSAGALAVTGAPLLAVVLLAGGLLATGVFLAKAGRRGTRSSAPR
jgi:hypothetical protein